MSRAALGVVLTLLWLVLLAPRYFVKPPEEPSTPVQGMLQAHLAGRLARLATLGSVDPKLRETALAMVDDAIPHNPADRSLQVARTLLLAELGRMEEALAVVEALPPLEPGEEDGLRQALQGILAGRGEPSLDGPVQEELTGFYRYLALHRRARSAGEGQRVELLTAQERALAEKDVVVLGGATGVLCFNLLAGVAMIFLWPLVGPALVRPLRSRPEPPSALRAWAAVVLFQFANTIPASLFAAMLTMVGMPAVPAIVVTQAGVYGLSAALLANLLGGRGSLVHRAGLATSRPARVAVVGLLGYWTALPAVLAANLATARLLDRSPFSTNPVLDLLAEASPAELAAMALVVVVLGPLFEEILFRGVLYPSLRQRLGVPGAVVLSAALFALVHGDPQGILVLATLGAIFAVLYEKTGTVWTSVVAHGLWNGTVMAMLAIILHSG